MYHAKASLLTIVLLFVSLFARACYSMEGTDSPKNSLSGSSDQVSLFIDHSRPPAPSGFYQSPQKSSEGSCGPAICICPVLMGCCCISGCVTTTIIYTLVLYASGVFSKSSAPPHIPLKRTYIAAVDYDFPSDADVCPTHYQSIGVLKVFSENSWYLDEGFIPQNLTHLNFTQAMNNDILNAYDLIAKSLCLNIEDVDRCWHKWSVKLYNTAPTDIQHIASQLDIFTKKDTVEDDGSTLPLKVVENQFCAREVD